MRELAQTRVRWLRVTAGSLLWCESWLTASTPFATLAVTIARALTDTFAGIRLADVPGFIGAQLVGGALAVFVFTWLMASRQGD